jgi:hypothetical protein
MRIETLATISALISVLGVTAAVGIRKKLPGMTERMRPEDNIIFERVGIQKLDNINLVDVISNDTRPRRLPNAIMLGLGRMVMATRGLIFSFSQSSQLYELVSGTPVY